MQTSLFEETPRPDANLYVGPVEKTFPPPRPFQVTAHESLRQGVREGHRCQVLMSATGSGKTYLGMMLISETLKKGRRCLFICDRTVLIDQTSAVADSYGLNNHGIIQRNHWRTDYLKPLQIASVQTLARRDMSNQEFDVVIVDECFVAGTLVDGRPIETLKIGDYVRSYNHLTNQIEMREILHVFKHNAHNLIKVSTDNGKNIISTANHPYFTLTGYVKADTISTDTILFSAETNNGASKAQNIPMHNLPKTRDFNRETIQQTRSEISKFNRYYMLRRMQNRFERERLQEAVRTNAVKQPYVRPIYPPKSKIQTFRYGTQTPNPRRQWEKNPGPASNAFPITGGRMDIRACCLDGLPKRARGTNPRQGGHCQPYAYDSNRGGWSQPLHNRAARARHPERWPLAPVRVVSVEVQEQDDLIESRRCSGEYRGVEVFNIEVEGNNNYFAEDILVHNCQDQYKGWIDLMTLFPNAKFIGLSATPFSKGLGKLFTNLINAATMHQLTTEPDPTSGKPVLVPMRIFSCHKVNMEGAATRGGEWTDEGAAERGMEIIGDVVADWELYGKGRKTIVFGPTIAHCEKMKDWFVSRGHQAMTFTADTTPVERADILMEYRKKDSGLDILISVAALAKGFDCPEVSCICDVRPLRKSLSTAIQMWGRGLRSAPDKTECLLLDFSGNIVRFADDFSDVYYNGLNQLHKGEKLDKKIRKDEDHIERACPKCGYKPCGKRCVQCGFQKKKQSLEEHAPGVMKEIIIGGKKAADDNHHLYKQLVSFTRNSSSQKPREWAWNLYKQITGEHVPNKWEGEFWMMPLCHVTAATKGKIQQLRIAFRHAIK